MISKITNLSWKRAQNTFATSFNTIETDTNKITQFTPKLKISLFVSSMYETGLPVVTDANSNIATNREPIRRGYQNHSEFINLIRINSTCSMESTNSLWKRTNPLVLIKIRVLEK